jgi:excisionase family DNA binding protein
MDYSLVAPRGDYGVAAAGAQLASGHAEVLLSVLDHRRSVSLVEAAGLIGVSSRTMRRYAAEGAVPGAFRLRPGSPWRFRRRDLEAWWAKLQGAAVRYRYLRGRKGGWQ